MYCLQDVGADYDGVGGVTGAPWGVRDGDRAMSVKRRGFTGNVDCRTTCNGNSVNHNGHHQVRNRSNARMNSARSSARPGTDAFTGRASNRTHIPAPSDDAFLRVDGVTMRPEPGVGDYRPNNVRCRGEQRRVKSAKTKAMIPATSRSLNIYSRSLSLTPDIYSLMHSPREAHSPRGTTLSKTWEDRCQPGTWSPNMSVPSPELTSNEWVKVLRANPGDPILQGAQVKANARYRQKTRCRHRPVSAGFYETTSDTARHRTDSSDVSESFQNLRLVDGYDIPSLTRCRRPKTAGPSLWRASDFVGIAEPKSALTPETPRTCRSAISVTKSALTPRVETPRSNKINHKCYTSNYTRQLLGVHCRVAQTRVCAGACPAVICAQDALQLAQGKCARPELWRLR
ncbi:hypothetical protein NP493_986g00034 [Ridgeia piscesae]|uniref:Uncharacterized protein n=1 Tax=Ridgeia piscesae TaxID=27915 RepID=A0AAD9KJ69_RIDPI|nr:hypothetical protein NP493_986g00034 [Ridgeia piscesae]